MEAKVYILLKLKFIILIKDISDVQKINTRQRS
jgi:hypothetical protein